MRMMAVFEKGQRLRHIGHLDIQRAMQRALRRSGLPVAYSKGFNPHILVTFASALATGAWGERELMDVTMASEVSPEAFVSAMNKALPPDMQLSEAYVLADKHPALMATLTAADYEITLLDEDVAARCHQALEAFLQQESIITLRKTKRGLNDCDIKPLIHRIDIDGCRIRALLTLTEAMACKPDMLVNALCAFIGCDVPRFVVLRKGLMGPAADGSLVALETL